MPANKSELKIGDKAPDFNLPTGGEGKLKLSDLRGRKVVPYFYPKDNTSGCTKEACGFNEELPDFRKLKAEIVGVSRDSVASHAGFKKKYGLGFKLVSDADAKACAAYGTWVEKSMYGRKYMGIDRATFLIDEKGVIRGIWRKVRVPGHVEEVLAAAKRDRERPSIGGTHRPIGQRGNPRPELVEGRSG